jgi:hypothetical protein
MAKKGLKNITEKKKEGLSFTIEVDPLGRNMFMKKTMPHKSKKVYTRKAKHRNAIIAQ